MNGVIVVNKEQDFTSFDVVAVMRGILHEKKTGHGGTLDPKAEGVLPVFVGSATKLCDFLPYDDKCYEAELTLGIETDTEDIWGTVLSEKPVQAGTDAVTEAVRFFEGGYDQVPPMYSAKKVDGKKLYEYARKGQEIVRKPVRVEIPSIEILSMELPKVRIRVSCSKGTYIRTLCADIGRRLGTGACMSALKRVRHGQFTLAEARTLKEIEEAVKAGKSDEILIPVERLFAEKGSLTVNEAGDKALMNGNLLTDSGIGGRTEGLQTDMFRVYDSAGVFRAVYGAADPEGRYRPLKMFLG